MKFTSLLLALALLSMVYRLPPPAEPVTLLFVGDIMLSRRIGAIMAEKNDWTYPFLQISDALKRADLVFANLESPISSRGTRMGSIYSFRADPRAVAGLSSAGIDVVSLANNHVWDYGPEALGETLDTLRSAGIDYIGAGVNYAAAHEPVIKDVRGTKIAFWGYTNLVPVGATVEKSAPAVAFLDLKQVIPDIARAKERADIVIVSFHWGNEYETKHNQKQAEIAYAVIDAGADLVIGHHPHVRQEVEKYHGGYIAYSLGNFVFDQNFSADTRTGLMLKVILKNKKIDQVEEQKIKFTSTYQPYMLRADLMGEYKL